jgi:hypothetical protein
MLFTPKNHLFGPPSIAHWLQDSASFETFNVHQYGDLASKTSYEKRSPIFHSQDGLNTAKLDGIQWVIDSLEADDIRHLEIILQALPSVKLADFFSEKTSISYDS